ncbi:DUF305 domain-containing protein [Streptomyces sp. NPDC004675]|uniref:DUF305 domain-containing protein n=1 Tax=Streptomyces sp. NPDC004675 TaxID=3154286 RepID=UPI0033AA3352
MLSPARRAITAVLTPAALTAPLFLAPSAPAATRSPVPSSGATAQEDQDETLLLRSAREYAIALANLPGPALEQAFLAGMIPHHAAAVAMARQELARGSRPELKAMAQNIISSQNKEISRMTGWLHTWYGLTPEVARTRVPHAVQQARAPMTTWMDTTTARLSTVPAGPRFDQAFMQAMIPHHETAAVASTAVPGHAVHDALTTLAQQIVAAQNAQVEQMRTWLHDWYPS